MLRDQEVNQVPPSARETLSAVITVCADVCTDLFRALRLSHQVVDTGAFVDGTVHRGFAEQAVTYPVNCYGQVRMVFR